MELEDLRRRLKDTSGDTVAAPTGQKPANTIEAVAPILPMPQAAAVTPLPSSPAEPHVSSSAKPASPAGRAPAFSWLALLVGGIAFAFAVGSYLGLPQGIQGVPVDARLGFLEQRTAMALALLGGVALLLCIHALVVLRRDRAGAREAASDGTAADIASTLGERRQAAGALAERPPARAADAPATRLDADATIEAAIRAIETSLAARLDNVLATVATRTQALNGNAEEIERASRDLATAARSAEQVLFPALREAGAAPADGPLAALAERLEAAAARMEQARPDVAVGVPGADEVIAAVTSLKETFERRAAPAGEPAARVDDGALLPLVERIDGLAERIVSLTMTVEEALDPGAAGSAGPVEVDLGPLAQRIDALAARMEAFGALDGGRGERAEDRALAGLPPRVTALAATVDELSETLHPRLDAINAAVDALAARPAADTAGVERSIAILGQDLTAARTAVIAAVAAAVEPLKPSLDALRGGAADVLARMDVMGADGARTRDTLADALATLQARLAAFDEAFGPRATLSRLDEIGAQVTSEVRMSRLAADGLVPQLRAQEALLDVVRNQGDRLLASIESLSREVAQASSALSAGERAGAAGLAGLAPAMAEALPRIEGGIADLAARLSALEAANPAKAQTPSG
jgi:hypothetical protein